MSNLALVPLVCAVIYGTLAVVAILRLTKARAVFALYLFSAAVWSLSSAMTHYELNPSQTYFWGKMILTAGIPMMVFYYQFIRSFTKKHADAGTYLGYLIVIIAVILSASGVFLKDAYFGGGQLFMRYIPFVTDAFLLFTFGYLITAGITLARFYRSSLSPIDRRRTIYLMVGMSAFAVFGLIKAIPAFSDHPVDFIGGTINALLITYAVLKYQLLDIRVVLRRGLVYSGLTVFLSMVYLLLLYAVQLFFQDRLGYTSLALAGIIALMTSVLFSPMRDFLQKWIDRLFYHNTYDYRQILLNFSGKINNVLDLDELQQSILQPLVETMHVEKAALLFPEVGSEEFKVRFVNTIKNENVFTKLRFTSDNPIVTWLEDKGEVLWRNLIDIMPQFKGMWEVEKTTLDVLGVELLCPIRSKGKLIGILALGEKRTRTAYTDDEASLLTTMANEAAVALENARMLDSLKSQQLQVEQLLGQVVLAQEEERNRISIDLHDSVAQWLVAVSYGIQTFRHDLPEIEVENARTELGAMEKTITKSLRELRRVVVGLRPPALDELGLTHAIRQCLNELEADGIECEYCLSGDPYRLPSSIEIAVYRVVQEATTNIRKHAGAGNVRLSVDFTEENIIVEVSDNGAGFNLSKTVNSAISVGHLGLLGMKQRVEMLGGDMNIRTAEGLGTTITYTFPVLTRVEER